MGAENTGTSRGDDELTQQIEDAPESIEGLEGDGEDERSALRAVAAATFRDEHGRITPGTPYAWKPGESGNPNGRPTDQRMLEDLKSGKRKDVPAKLMTEAVRKVLDDPLVRAKLAEKWVLQSARNPGYMKQIWERLEGKVPFTLRVGPEVEPESQTDLAITVIDVKVESFDELKAIAAEVVPDDDDRSPV